MIGVERAISLFTQATTLIGPPAANGTISVMARP
jgi:hypothetical protein